VVSIFLYLWHGWFERAHQSLLDRPGGFMLKLFYEGE